MLCFSSIEALLPAVVCELFTGECLPGECTPNLAVQFVARVLVYVGRVVVGGTIAPPHFCLCTRACRVLQLHCGPRTYATGLNFRRALDGVSSSPQDVVSSSPLADAGGGSRRKHRGCRSPDPPRLWVDGGPGSCCERSPQSPGQPPRGASSCVRWSGRLPFLMCTHTRCQPAAEVCGPNPPNPTLGTFCLFIKFNCLIKQSVSKRRPPEPGIYNLSSDL
jgi:hypothetical protein